MIENWDPGFDPEELVKIVFSQVHVLQVATGGETELLDEDLAWYCMAMKDELVLLSKQIDELRMLGELKTIRHAAQEVYNTTKGAAFNE